jgi:hypothetical protein
MAPVVYTKFMSITVPIHNRQRTILVESAAQPKFGRNIQKSLNPDAVSLGSRSERNEAHQKSSLLTLSIPVDREQTNQINTYFPSQINEPNRIEWLKRFLPFASLGDSAVQQLALAFHERDIFPGEKLLTSGAEVRELMVIRTGRAEVIQQKHGDQGELRESVAYLTRIK